MQTGEQPNSYSGIRLYSLGQVTSSALWAKEGFHSNPPDYADVLVRKCARGDRPISEPGM